jgi:colanic acid biosynthesis protein WcaH
MLDWSMCDMALQPLIVELESKIINSAQGLPEDVFLFVSRLTPMVNVDLLLKNAQNQTLLTWRDDEYYGPGWHVPGGIVRYKESFATRIAVVAANELGANVVFTQTPLAMNEIMHPTRNTRGHFISFLYACTLTSSLDPQREYKTGKPQSGEWAWHADCPENLIAVHEIYRQFIAQAA